MASVTTYPVQAREHAFDKAVQISVETAGRVVSPNAVKTVKAVQDGNYAQAAVGAAMTANYVLMSKDDAKSVWEGTKSAVNKIRGLDELVKRTSDPNKITEFQFFDPNGTIIGKRLHNSDSVAAKGLLKLDKTILDLPGVSGRLGVEKITGADGIAYKAVGASTGRVKEITARACGIVPLGGLALSAAYESFNLVKAAENDDLVPQLGRSALNIAGTTAASALAGGALSKANPGLALVASAVAALGASAAFDKNGRTLFGEPKSEHKKDLDITQQANQLSGKQIVVA